MILPEDVQTDDRSSAYGRQELKSYNVLERQVECSEPKSPWFSDEGPHATADWSQIGRVQKISVRLFILATRLQVRGLVVGLVVALETCNSVG